MQHWLICNELSGWGRHARKNHDNSPLCGDRLQMPLNLPHFLTHLLNHFYDFFVFRNFLIVLWTAAKWGKAQLIFFLTDTTAHMAFRLPITTELWTHEMSLTMCGLLVPCLENQFDYVQWQQAKGGPLGDTAGLATFMPIFFLKQCSQTVYQQFLQ